MRKKILPLLCTFLCGSLLLPAIVWSAPRVVVSIKPIHALVAGVMQGVGEPQLLVKGGASPHGYVLRPSDARALSRADLIVWVGPQLESFLKKPLATLGKRARQLQLTKVLADRLLPLRKSGSWEEHQHHERADGDGEHGEFNPHLWLDPRLAEQIVAKTAAILGEIDPVHRPQYQQNATRLQARLAALHARLKAKLAPVKHIPFIVFHDAYQYFEAAYGLNAIGSISIDPERKPGARRIRQMRQKIKQLNVRCVFSEPQFEPRLLATIIEGTDAGTGVLDPLGADLPAGPESYFQLLNALADNLLAGLRGPAAS
ncbi:MAG: zinc ABC transporter solute-binding protein [Deltaproteobacteria bacterium]|nr:zinc ABC transporter solute-binding protein [Deltaproteobacteria bacterium]